MSDAVQFLGVVAKIAGDLTTVPTDETTLQAILAASGGGGGSGGSSAQPVGAALLATNQVTVGVSAVLLAAARTGAAGTGRVAITILNNGSVPIYLGLSSAVTTSTGLPVPAGSAVTINTTASIYAISGTASQNVGVLETF